MRLSTVQPEASDVSWCCQIKLRKEYDKNNKQLESRPTEEVFKTLYDSQKDVLHHYITAAQRALLNPESPADMFAKLADTLAAQSGGNDGHTSSSGRASPAESEATSKDVLAFTRNVIVLEITGADVDLALIDLPGIIQTEQADDGTNVELVQQLVKQYISRQRTIIVATITCKDDIDNQVMAVQARSLYCQFVCCSSCNLLRQWQTQISPLLDLRPVPVRSQAELLQHTGSLVTKAYSAGGFAAVAAL